MVVFPLRERGSLHETARVHQAISGAAIVWPLAARVARTAPVLRAGAALPDPPFEFMTKDGSAGFDITLMQRIAEMLGRESQLVPYEGGRVQERLRAQSHLAGMEGGCSNTRHSFPELWRAYGPYAAVNFS